MTQDRLLTLDEVADRLRTPVNTLRYWRQTGKGPAGIKVGRRVLYASVDVETWLEQQRSAA